MSLQNSKYDYILHQYDSRRLHAKYLLDKRTERIYNECPEILDIDNLIAVDSINRAKRAIMGESDALIGLAEDNEQLEKKKEAILLAHGYPADFLTPKYTCELCHDMGFIGRERCTCFKKALAELAIKESNIGEVLERENFDTFDYSLFSDAPEDIDPRSGLTPRAHMKQNVVEIRDLLKDFDNTHPSFYIYGTTGVGKTFLTNCIAKEVLDRGHTVLYYTAYRFFEFFENAYFSGDRNNNGTGETETPDKLMNCDMLIIDDLGTELTNSFTSSVLYSVINERMINRRSTIITTNLNLAEFEARYTERLSSRITQDYTLRRIVGQDIRLIDKNLMA